MGGQNNNDFYSISINAFYTHNTIHKRWQNHMKIDADINVLTFILIFTENVERIYTIDNRERFFLHVLLQI